MSEAVGSYLADCVRAADNELVWECGSELDQNYGMPVLIAPRGRRWLIPLMGGHVFDLGQPANHPGAFADDVLLATFNEHLRVSREWRDQAPRPLANRSPGRYLSIITMVPGKPAVAIDEELWGELSEEWNFRYQRALQDALGMPVTELDRAVFAIDDPAFDREQLRRIALKALRDTLPQRD
jgi:hypothetical protein